ncbi:MAG TPA: DNA repair protein RadA [Dehalococcoidia bacterium]|nr:DNA repair protein RadA [Dehalococcoidia bacterium]
MTTGGKTLRRSVERVSYACTECGHESPKWAGRCPGCEAWNSFVQHSTVTPSRRNGVAVQPPVEIARLDVAHEPRLPVGISELDRALGGGIVAGSLVLLGGDPGIGKSTLLLQVAASLGEAGRSVLYIAGEESPSQIKLRAARLGIAGSGLFVASDTNIESALAAAGDMNPALVVVDSIQTVYSETAEQAPGSLAQLRQCTMALMRWAKESAVPVFVVGHVTKDGDIAGPRLLEHIVDVVLYLEGERFSAYRLLRGVKNRFGSVDEVGVFEMTGGGMRGVENPSEAFIAERAADAIGSAVVPTLEGSRPVLVEVQALTSPTVTPAPRRTGNGLDTNRLLLVSAVLSRRLNLPLAGVDVIANVVGGLRISEPAVDLGLALAIASSHKDRAMPADIVAVGEIGLSGELRSVSHLERRLLEAERLGFKRCVIPEATLHRQRPRTAIELLAVPDLRAAVRAVLG